jgi:hypothetical protein
MLYCEGDIMSIFNKEEILGLLVGLLVIMLLVWVTLPSEHDRVISKKCFKSCKEVIEQMDIESGIFSGPLYEMSECYEECIEETRNKNENND